MLLTYRRTYRREQEIRETELANNSHVSDAAILKRLSQSVKVQGLIVLREDTFKESNSSSALMTVEVKNNSRLSDNIQDDLEFDDAPLRPDESIRQNDAANKSAIATSAD